MRALFLLVALLVQPAAHAQTPPAPSPGPASAPTPDATEARARLIAADTNKDGKWNKAEWMAAGRRERGFEMFDTNSDGFVTQAEIRDGRAKMQTRRGTPE